MDLSTFDVGFIYLGASHPRCSDNPRPPPDDATTLNKLDFIEDSAEHPPFAWIDARDGWSSDRWGSSLVGTSGMDYSLHFLESEVNLWRWLGYVFWDRERVERMKEIAALEDYITGWLTDLRGKVPIVLHPHPPVSNDYPVDPRRNWIDSEDKDEG